MCKDCEEITWEIDESKPAFDETTCRALTFMESDCLDVWKSIVESHTADQIATFLTQIVEFVVGKTDNVSIHPVIGQFCITYEKILNYDDKKFVFFEHFCSIAFTKGQ
jgi:predicted membrane-bound mannosyltransferase